MESVKGRGVTTQPLRKYDSSEQNDRVITFGGSVVEVERKEPNNIDPSNGHQYVEIAGIKWATMNVGATSETDYGLYFQWGDTQGYTASQVGTSSGQKAFNWADYKFNPSGDGSTFTKYTGSDDKTMLDIEDDAARANMGGQWRMPTTEEIEAFQNAVITEWKTDYNGSGVNGLLCTDKDDNSKKLFFPAAGCAYNGNMYAVGNGGFVFGSSLNSTYVNSGEGWGFGDDTGWDFFRCLGYSVRGVLGTKEQLIDVA